MTEQQLNDVLTRFAEGRAGVTLTLALEGCWLMQELNQWPITGDQADKVLTAMRCMRVEKVT